MPVQPGDEYSFKASTWNKIEKLVNAPANNIGGLPAQSLTGMRHLVRIKNGTEEAVARGGVLSWDGVVISASKSVNDYWRRPVLNGKEPSMPDDDWKIAIAQEPIPAGEIGLAAIGGVTPAYVEIADEDHTHAVLKDGSISELVSADSGTAAIVDVSDIEEEGATLCQVCLGVGSGVSLYHFTLTEAMGATTPNLASCTIYTADGVTRTEHETEQTLYDPDGYLVGAPSGVKGPCIRDGGKYYAMNASCGS